MSKRKTIAGELLKEGYVLESCFGNKGICFELWIAHATKMATIVWTIRGDDGTPPHSSIVRFDAETPVDMFFSSPTDTFIHSTVQWMALVVQLASVFPLAFPEEGLCYPDVLTRSFEAAMTNYEVGPMQMED